MKSLRFALPFEQAKIAKTVKKQNAAIFVFGLRSSVFDLGLWTWDLGLT